MNTTDYLHAKAAVYSLAHNVCENGNQQNSLINALREIESESEKIGCSNKEIIRNLLFPLVDGLSYGNWPWIKNGINTLSKK